MSDSPVLRRADILRTVIPGAALPLWVPLLTPWTAGSGDVDVDRFHLRRRVLAAHTTLWMVGGTTGDGWELDDRQFEQLVRAALDAPEGVPRGHLLFALLGPTTAAVIERLNMLREMLGVSPEWSFERTLEHLRPRGVVGICLAPPVGEDIDQLSIAHHFEEVGRRARMPIALYEIPQVTGCRIAPETFNALVGSHEEIVLFKDSSGEDRLAAESSMLDSPVLVRGFESDYATALRAGGGDYDGLLLGSANNFGQELVAIVRATLSGMLSAAGVHASALQRRNKALFQAVAPAGVGNAFANANRAVDHVLAYGNRVAEVDPPALFDGSTLDRAIVESVVTVLDREGLRPTTGYLDLA